MGFYTKHILPRCLDKACGIGPITKQREKIVPLAEGVVLEVGIGSGQNLPHYDPGKVTKIIGVDPDDHIWKRSEKRPYSLCTIPDPVKALREMTRILKPDGKILFSEHGKAPDAKVHRWQNRIDPLWKKIAGGCHSGRDIPALFHQADLKLLDLQEMYIPGPKVISQVQICLTGAVVLDGCP